MNLDEQIQALIDGAPDVESRMSVMAIAPILQQVAATLPHLEYYICQSPQGEWAITTLRHRQQPNLEIKVIYAFTKIQDISGVDREALNLGVAVKIPIVQLLFDLLACPEIDRIVFFNDSQHLVGTAALKQHLGQEISRQDLENSIVMALQQRATPTQQTSSLPPDVC
jgi:hypothetical protein